MNAGVAGEVFGSVPAAACLRQRKRSRSQIAKVGGWRKSVPRGTRWK